MNYKKTYEELNVLLPFSPDVKVQQNQREKMAMMGFLATSFLSMIMLRCRLYLVLKFLLSKKRSVEYSAQKYPLLLYNLPR